MRIMIIMDRLFNNTGPQEIPSSSNQSPDSREDTPTIAKSILNCHDIIAGMSTVFDAEAAGDLTADIQFDVSGEEPGSYYLHIENGTCDFFDGAADSPSLTIHTPSEVWLSISRGEMDGQAALMQGKYSAEGDYGLLLLLNDIFL